MNYPKLPSYYRARIDALHQLRSSASDEAIVLIRNGIFPQPDQEEQLILDQLNQNQYTNQELSFFELCSANTWFNIHPELIAGTEIRTTSREFPIQIKGSFDQINQLFEIGSIHWIPVPLIGWKVTPLEADLLRFDSETTSIYAERTDTGSIELSTFENDQQTILRTSSDETIEEDLQDLLASTPSELSELELEALALEIELQLFSL